MQLYCLYGLTKFEKEFIVKLKINSTGLRSEENREEQMKRKFFCKRNIIICCIVFYIMLEYATKYEIKIYNKKCD